MTEHISIGQQIKKIPTYPGIGMVSVDDYNTGMTVPNTCCGHAVNTRVITVAVSDTNLAVPESMAHLVKWQCLVTEDHHGKSIFLGYGTILEEGSLDVGLSQEE